MVLFTKFSLYTKFVRTLSHSFDIFWGLSLITHSAEDGSFSTAININTLRTILAFEILIRHCKKIPKYV